VAFATQFGAQLILLHVIEPTAQGFPYPALALENDQVKATMKRRLEGLGKYETTNPRLIQKAAVTHGRAFQEVVRAARGLQVDLIIMATHGYTGIKHVLLGSTTERVVRYAPCPVLVVREQEESLKVLIQTPRMRHD
jgi:nucleotide-binding universal stress UspA family protein